MSDGSRCFAWLPESCSWHELKGHLQTLQGVVITEFLTDHVTEMWLDFTFQGNAFTVNNPLGEFWLFVKTPACDNEILTAVIEHCEALLLPK
jgi:hypothetical protein